MCLFWITRKYKYNPKSTTSAWLARITKQQSTSPMKKIAIIPASILLCTVAMSSCNSNKLAIATTDDNMYFMSADVKKASQNAVANNQPATFQNLANVAAVPQDNFSSKNVNPEYLSRYGQVNGAADQDVVYFDDSQQAATGTTPNIDIYNNFSVYNGNAAWRNPTFNMGFSPFGMGMGIGFNPIGMGMGFSPFGMPMMGFSPFGFGIYDPFINPWRGWRPGWGNPMFNNFGGRFYDPFWGGGQFGSPWGWGRPILATGPIIVLPGSEFGDRRVVYGARPSRGSSFTNGAGGLMQNSGVPSTARAQARENVANANGASPRRMGANESSRAASRDFSTSQNDYYSTGRSRVESTTRNVNSAASGRGTVSNTRNSSSSARPSASPANVGRSYGATPSRSSYSTTPSRSTNRSPSYNRSTGTTNGSRSTNSSGRNGSSSYNSGSSPSRSSSNSSSFSAPSRVSSGGSSYSAPSRSSSGSSGGSSSGGSRGRGN
jgi:hypothetical protein